MQLRIERKWKKSGYCIGKLYVNGMVFSNTLEDEDRGLDNRMSVSTILSKKVYGETAIPTGTYRMRMSYSPKFAKKTWGERYKGVVPEICDVPGYSGVRIHPGSQAGDTLGCPLVGMNTVKGKLTSSQLTYYRLMDEHLIPAMNRNETIYITIV